MVKRDLVGSLMRSFPGIAKRDIMDVVNTIFESIARALMQGEAVDLRGLGRFKIKQRDAMRGRNPKTGMYVDIPERWAVHFRPSENLTSRINPEKCSRLPTLLV